MIRPVARPLPAQDNTNTEETLVDVDATIPMFEREKTFHPLDRAIIVIVVVKL
jgi:hypothetical protein